MGRTFGNPDSLGAIHDVRIQDATAQVFQELRALKIKKVNALLDSYNIQILKRHGSEYRKGAPQVLENELKSAKGEL